LLHILLLCISAYSLGQTDSAEKANQLIAEEKWQAVVNLTESTSTRSADLNYYYGTALAHLERWPEAHKAFQAGSRQQPSDERFPLELAGVDFKQKRYADTATHLRRALRLAPNDSYASEFLATVYFLQGNQEAAVKYWNRVEKPKIASVRTDPKPRVDPALLDHAFTFAPASVLRLPDLLTTEARVQGLAIFPTFSFDLQAREDGQFDLTFRNHEQNGFGSNKLEVLIRLFRELPGQTVNPEYFNFRRKAINFISMYRWDAQKRRVRGEISGPLRENPKRRVAFGVDLRGENWDIRESFTGMVPLLGSFNMRREAVNAGITSIQNGRWHWAIGAELSHRDFRDVFLGTALTPELLSKGYQLKQTTQVYADIWRAPENRMTLSGRMSSDAGRIWSDPAQAFEKLKGTVSFHWFPQAQGDDYEVLHELSAGKTWGDVPFDELYTLGGLGDNNLMMRGHITTHDGRKGSGPLGRNYFLSNWEMDKNIFDNGGVAVKLGPFLDTGKITDPLPGLGSHKWLWDTGGQVKVRAFGFGVAFIYGRDLRSGHDAFFVTLAK
jgi:hypothetical protein